MAEEAQNNTFLSAWQTTVDENFNDYQEAINKVTYGLQRGQSGFLGLGAHFYPYFYQSKLINLDLLKKKQFLGKINQDEIDRYAKNTPNIRQILLNTFNSNRYWPVQGAQMGLGLVLLQSYFNTNWTLRLSTFFIMCAYDWTNSRFSRSYPIEAVSFLNYTLAYRTAKARVELGASRYDAGDVAAVKELAGNEGNVLDMYEQLSGLVKADNPKASGLI